MAEEKITEQDLVKDGWNLLPQEIYDGKGEQGAKLYEKIIDGARTYKTVDSAGEVKDYNP